MTDTEITKVGDWVQVIETKYGDKNDKYIGRTGEVLDINSDGHFLVDTDEYQPDQVLATKVKKLAQLRNK